MTSLSWRPPSRSTPGCSIHGIVPLERSIHLIDGTAPEEHQRGATVEERTTAFTVARAARVFLGDGDTWRAGPALASVVDRATCVVPEDRYPTYDGFAAAWRRAR